MVGSSKLQSTAYCVAFDIDDVFGCLLEYNVQHLFAGSHSCFCILIKGAQLDWHSLAVFGPSGTEVKLDSSESTVVTDMSYDLLCVLVCSIHEAI